MSHTKTQKIYISIRHFMPHKAKGGHHCERAILRLTINVYEQEISKSESNLKRKWNDEDFRIYKEEIAL